MPWSEDERLKKYINILVLMLRNFVNILCLTIINVYMTVLRMIKFNLMYVIVDTRSKNQIKSRKLILKYITLIRVY